MLWITILLAIVCILVCLTLLPIEIRIKFHHIRSDDGGVVEIRYLFGIVRVKRELNQISAHPSEKGAAITTSTTAPSSVGDDKNQTSAIEVTQLLGNLHNILANLRRSAPILKQLSKHLHIVKFDFDAALGVNDAVYTGMAVGTAHIGIQGFIGWMSRHCRLRSRPKVQIEAIYQGTAFDVQFESIIQVRLGYAISAVRKLFIVWKRRT